MRGKGTDWVERGGDDGENKGPRAGKRVEHVQRTEDIKCLEARIDDNAYAKGRRERMTGWRSR